MVNPPKTLISERNGERSIGGQVHELRGKKADRYSSAYEVMPYTYYRSNSCDFKIKAKTPLTIVPTLFEGKAENAFVIKVYVQVANRDTKVSFKQMK